MDLPKIISVDDHVVEPAHVWERWLPAKYRDRGPKVVRRGIQRIDMVNPGNYKEVFDDDSPTKVDCWIYEDLVFTQKRHIAAAGYPPEEHTLTPMTYDEMRPGCYDPKARLEDMDRSWVEASMCFPTFPRFCGQTFAERSDKELGLACVKAYNDWMVEEWCGDSNGRLIPLCLIPLWDVPAAVEEVRRNAARGRSGGLLQRVAVPPRLADDPLRALGPVLRGVCRHRHDGGDAHRLVVEDARDLARCARLGQCHARRSTTPCPRWSTSCSRACCARFPALKLVYAEGQIGWIPYVLQRVDQVWEDNQAWAQTKHIPEPPSTYYYQSVYGCFINDPHGLSSLDEIGLGNVTAETDYPHSDSTWPDTKEVMTKLTAGLSDTEIHQILRGNAITLLRLPFA